MLPAAHPAPPTVALSVDGPGEVRGDRSTVRRPTIVRLRHVAGAAEHVSRHALDGAARIGRVAVARIDPPTGWTLGAAPVDRKQRYCRAIRNGYKLTRRFKAERSLNAPPRRRRAANSPTGHHAAREPPNRRRATKKRKKLSGSERSSILVEVEVLARQGFF